MFWKRAKAQNKRAQAKTGCYKKSSDQLANRMRVAFGRWKEKTSEKAKLRHKLHFISRFNIISKRLPFVCLFLFPKNINIFRGPINVLKTSKSAVFSLVVIGGLEPPTLWVWTIRSNQLSYITMLFALYYNFMMFVNRFFKLINKSFNFMWSKRKQPGFWDVSTAVVSLPCSTWRV